MARPILRRASKIVYGGVALLLVAALTYSVSTPQSGPRVHLGGIALSDYGSASGYQLGETYGGTNPIATCMGCDFWGHQIVGTSTPPTTDPSQLVNPLTGDVAERYSLFSQPDPGVNFGLNLTYDAQWGQLLTYLDAINGNTGNEFYGYGWRSNLSSNVIGSGGSSTSTDTKFAVSLPGGALENFYPTTGACPSVGNPPISLDYKTASGSSATFCAPNRVNALFSAYNNYANYQLYAHGGLQVYTYDFYGELVNQGSIEDPGAQTVLWRQSPNQSGCPATIGSETVSQCTSVFDQQGRSYAVAWLGSNNVYTVAGVKDPTGAIWSLGVNGQGDLANVVDPNSHAWSFGYDSGNGAPDQNDLNVIQDPNGNQTHLTYTASSSGNGGFVSSVTDAMGNQTTYSGYTTNEVNGTFQSGWNATQNNPDGQQIVYGIQSNFLHSETVAGQSTFTSFTGTPTAPSENIQDPMGNQTNVWSDEVGNVLQTQNSYGTTTSTYNQYSEPCWIAPPNVSYPSNRYCATWPTIGQGATIFDADAYGNMQETIDPTGVATETQHDGNGFPCWQSMPGVIQGSWPACSSPPADATRFSYSTGGNLLSKATPDGSGGNYFYDTTSYAYNGYGEATRQTDPLNNPTTFNYDAAGRLYQTVAPLNRTTTAQLDAAGNVDSVTDPMSEVTSAAYDANNRVCWSFQGTASPLCGSAPQTATKYSYNSNTSAPLSVTDPNGKTTNYLYQDLRFQTKPTAVTDALGNITSNVYDANGDTCVSGTASTSLWSGATPSCVATGGYSFKTFDQLGNIMTQTDPLGLKTSYTRGDAAFPGEVTSITPQNNGTLGSTSYTYDSDGRPVLTQEGNGNVVSFAYDAAGQKCWQAPVNNTSATCATSVPVGGNSWSYNYSGLPGSMSDVTPSGTRATTWTYDKRGSVTSQTNSNGTVGYGYNAAGDNTCVAYPVVSGSLCANSPSPFNSVVDYGVNSDGQMTSLSDWLGNSYTFGYDGRSNLTSIGYPTATTETQNLGPYDAANNFHTLTLTSPTNGTSSVSYPTNNNEELAAAGATAYGYNAQSRLTSAGGNSYGYSPNGEIQTATVGGTTNTSTYSSDGELQSNGPFAPTLLSVGANQFSIGASTTSQTLSVPLNATAAPGELVLVEVSMTTSESVTNAGNCSQVAYVSNSPDALQVFACITHGGETSESITFGSTLDTHAEVVQAFLYDNVNAGTPIDAISQPGTATNNATLNVPGVTTTHAGDRLVVLQGAVNTIGSSGFNVQSGMTERANDQSGSPQTDAGEAQSNSAVPAGPTGSVSSGLTGTVSQATSAGVLIALNPAPNTYGFDANGNRCAENGGSTQPTCAVTGAGTTSWGYNAFNEMCFAASNPGAAGSCSSPPGGATTYAYDGSGLRVSDSTGHNFSYDTQTRPGTPLVIDDGSNAYIYGPAEFGSGTAPIEQIASGTGSTATYLVNSPAGVTQQLSATGSSTSTEAYSEFGTPTVTSGSKSTPFGFQGGYTDSTGLIYFVNRYYDPTTGQFISMDPMVGITGQPYSGFGDNPVNATDPLGLCSMTSCSASPAQSAAASAQVETSLNLLQACAQRLSLCEQFSNLVAFARAFDQWIAEVNAAGAAFRAAAKAETVNEDFINWGNPNDPAFNVPSFYYGGCFALFIGIVCSTNGHSNHLSYGLYEGIPGISFFAGFVKGATADKYLCGASVGGDFNYGGFGMNYGTNPGTGDYGSGLAIGTPGAGLSQTNGVRNC